MRGFFRFATRLLLSASALQLELAIRPCLMARSCTEIHRNCLRAGDPPRNCLWAGDPHQALEA